MFIGFGAIAPVYTKDNLDPTTGKKECRVLSSFSTDPEHSGVIKLDGFDVISGSQESLLCFFLLLFLLNNDYILVA